MEATQPKSQQNLGADTPGGGREWRQSTRQLTVEATQMNTWGHFQTILLHILYYVDDHSIKGLMEKLLNNASFWKVGP